MIINHHGCGIYKIVCLSNNKIYIGYANDFYDRFHCHRKRLRRNIHENITLQRAYNKYGEESFLFEVIETCEEKDLCRREHFWALKLNSHNKKIGYNLRPTDENGKSGRSIESIRKVYKPVIKYDKKGNLIQIFESVKAAAESIKVLPNAVSDVLRGAANTVKGYHFVYKTDKIEEKVLPRRDEEKFNNMLKALKVGSNKISLKIEVFDGEKSLGIFSSILQASIHLNINYNYLRDCRLGKVYKRKLKKFEEYKNINIKF